MLSSALKTDLSKLRESNPANILSEAKKTNPNSNKLTDLSFLVFLDFHTLKVLIKRCLPIFFFLSTKVRDPGGPNSGRVSLLKGPL